MCDTTYMSYEFPCNGNNYQEPVHSSSSSSSELGEFLNAEGMESPFENDPLADIECVEQSGRKGFDFDDIDFDTLVGSDDQSSSVSTTDSGCNSPKAGLNVVVSDAPNGSSNKPGNCLATATLKIRKEIRKDGKEAKKRGRKRKNIDFEGQLAMAKENQDKGEEMKIKNRMSAQRSRDKKKTYIEELECHLQAQNESMKALQVQVEALLSENCSLKANRQFA